MPGASASRRARWRACWASADERALRARRRRVLERGGEREQRTLARRAPDELDREREAVVAVEQRHGDGGLAARVEDRRERREVAGLAEGLERLGRRRVERTERQRPL